MFIMNGIVYAGTPTNNLSVLKVKVLPDYMLLVTFSTGETRLFDSTILNGEVFEPLKDENVFKSAIVDHGIVAWADGEIDCSPEFMYNNSYEYSTKEIC